MGRHTAHTPIGALLLRYLDGVDGGSDDKAAPRPAALKPTSRNVPENAPGSVFDEAGVVNRSVMETVIMRRRGAHHRRAIVTGRVCRAAGIG